MNGFSEKQLQILAFPYSSYDSIICDGAIRSGKTSIMSVAFLVWAMQGFDKCNFGLCSKTVQTAERNVIKPLLALDYIKERYSIRWHRTASCLEVSGDGHFNTFYIYGGKDESSYSLIQGITLAGILLDEVALMPRSFVEQAMARCSVKGRKIWFNCNPEGQLHWFNQEWILQPEKHNSLHLHFTLDDNPSLDEEIKRGYHNMYSGVFYDRYIRGLWVTAEGLIYDMFGDKHVLKELPELEGKYYVSSDFGIQNATVFLLWQKMRDCDKWVCLDEYYYSGRDEHKQKTTSELTEGLKEMLGDRIPKFIIIDPSAAALKVELRKAGFKTRDADNDVLNGIADTGDLLKNERLYVMENCTNTIAEFGVYVWDEKAAKRGEDVPVKANDHCMDAVRYMVRTMHLSRRQGIKKDYLIL